MSALPAERPHKPRRRRNHAASPHPGSARRARPVSTEPTQRERAADRITSDRPRRSDAVASFAEIGVAPEIVEILTAAEITQPFPVQAATLPDALSGRDVLGRGRTGSGKTLAFSIPLAMRLAGARSKPGRPRGLVLVPTRELANQVHAVLSPIARAMRLSVITVFGGAAQGPQVMGLRKGADIVVACPGRLADLIRQGHCRLDAVQVSVLDEADHMADLGFLPVVRQLLEATPSTGQRLLFSATLDNAVDVLVKTFLSSPAIHSVDSAAAPTPKAVHHLLTVEHEERFDVLATLASGHGRSVIFTKTKHGAIKLARQLTEAQIPAVDLHGNLNQRARERNLASFTTGSARVLVATDIAARGIHVDGVELVVHADPPAEHKAYLHRSGRTARAGAAGIVVTLQTRAQERGVRSLMKRANVSAAKADVTPDSPLLREIAGEAAPLVPSDGERSAARTSNGKPSETGSFKPRRSSGAPKNATGQPSRSASGRGGRLGARRRGPAPRG